MSFNWVRFFDRYGIEYQTSGANVARGNVNIQCRFCGAGDHGFHMGVSLQGKGWACWRSREHRGTNPARLVEVLIGCSREQANRIVGNTAPPLPNLRDLSSMIRDKLGVHNEEDDEGVAPLVLPREFKRIKDSGMGRQFVSYLEKRGYRHDEVFELAEQYNLRYCVGGPFQGRVVLPVYTELGLTTWTGRTIYNNVQPRYKTLTVDPAKAKEEGTPIALRAINRCLFNYESLMQEPGHTLAVLEGGFDALRVDFYGRARGIRATCLFGMAVYAEQIAALERLAPLYQRKIVMVDRGELVSSMVLEQQLAHLHFEHRTTPGYAKDPGEMKPKQIWKTFA